MEEGGGVGAPHPVMAMADDLGVAVKLVQGLRDGCEWNQDRSLDLGRGIFPGFPDIHQYDLVAFIQSLFEFLNGYGESHVRGLPLRTTLWISRMFSPEEPYHRGPLERLSIGCSQMPGALDRGNVRR